ncbi:hypothetical protein ACQR7C_26640 (plasmid) [Salmonella enterica]|uniref:hypothetical protein n=1 Tax=Salmonella enterica TaxID=28901 RepID=UPI003D2F1F78
MNQWQAMALSGTGIPSLAVLIRIFYLKLRIIRLNKIFKVKRNLKKNTSVVVSELASNYVCQSTVKANVLLLLAGFLFHTTSQASIIANKPYSYQEYLDIPQNKGG